MKTRNQSEKKQTDKKTSRQINSVRH